MGADGAPSVPHCAISVRKVGGQTVGGRKWRVELLLADFVLRVFFAVLVCRGVLLAVARPFMSPPWRHCRDGLRPGGWMGWSGVIMVGRGGGSKFCPLFLWSRERLSHFLASPTISLAIFSPLIVHPMSPCWHRCSDGVRCDGCIMGSGVIMVGRGAGFKISALFLWARARLLHFLGTVHNVVRHLLLVARSSDVSPLASMR